MQTSNRIFSILNQNSGLKSHMHIHSDDERHVCDIYKTQISLSSNLKNKMRVHTGGHFRCDTCGATFAYNRGLQSHKRSHIVEKPDTYGDTYEHP